MILSGNVSKNIKTIPYEKVIIVFHALNCQEFLKKNYFFMKNIALAAFPVFSDAGGA
jgi:hypothetical protein